MPIDYDPQNIFGKILRGEIPSHRVYEDDDTVAFMDVMPQDEGHTLIVPRRHGAYLKEMDPEDGGAMFKAGIRIGAALRASGLKCEGVNLLLNDGAEAGQRVFHSHLHVIPRIIGDSLRRDLMADIPLRSVLDDAAAKIKAALV